MKNALNPPQQWLIWPSHCLTPTVDATTAPSRSEDLYSNLWNDILQGRLSTRHDSSIDRREGEGCSAHTEKRNKKKEKMPQATQPTQPTAASSSKQQADETAKRVFVFFRIFRAFKYQNNRKKYQIIAVGHFA
jgi:hypothetical protein